MQSASPKRVPPRWRRRSKPRMAPSGAGLTAHAFVSRFGEKRDSSRALHPPSAARYFVGGIPPSRLARVRWRITRTVAAPFPCAHSSHMRRYPDLPLWRVFLRSLCARRRLAGVIAGCPLRHLDRYLKEAVEGVGWIDPFRVAQTLLAIDLVKPLGLGSALVEVWLPHENR